MHHTQVMTSARRPMLLAALLGSAGALACPAPGGNDGNETTEDTGTQPDYTLEWSTGCKSEPWTPLADGDSVRMVLGGQGLLMLPMPLRLDGVDLPDELTPTGAQTPILGLEVRVEGHAYLPNDTFARIANYPVLFKPVDGDPQANQFNYLTVFVPDEISDNPQVVDGLVAEYRFTLKVEGQPTLEGVHEFVLEVPDIFEPDPTCEVF